MELKELYQHYLQSNGVSIDTRTIKSGELFFGLVGERFNGSLYAKQALEEGASKVVVQGLSKHKEDGRYIHVDDVLKSLQDLAKYHRSQLTIPVIGITGSNGKTTTKELLYEVLSTQYKVGATKGNYNNHIGVPLTLLNVDHDVELLIVEMGTNQPGDIAELCEIADPNHGIITNIGASHLERLGSREGVYIEKRKLFDHVKSLSGTFFLNVSDDLLVDISDEEANIITYRSDEGLYGKLSVIESADDHLSLRLKTDKSSYDIRTNLSGAYNIENISACLSIAHYFNVDIEQSIKSVESYLPSNMRSQVIQTQRNVIILDAYNANPTSMKASVSTFDKGGREVLMILGDMLELGKRSDQYHNQVVSLLSSLNINAILIGRTFSKIEQPHYATFDNVQALIDSGELDKINNHHILIKASRGVRLEEIVPYL